MKLSGIVRIDPQVGEIAVGAGRLRPVLPAVSRTERRRS